MSLHHCVNDIAVIRDGHKPFHRTIADALDESARASVEHAWLRDMLEDMATGRRRNHEHGGACENCGKDGFLITVEVAEVTFDLCRGCRKLDPKVLLDCAIAYVAGSFEFTEEPS